MDYTKDVFFKVNYNPSPSLIKIEQQSWTSKFLEKVKQYKLLVLTLIAITIFSILNVIMICSFMNILQNI